MMHTISKKLPATEVHLEDLISNLPDDVICHILSRPPTKDVVRTYVLSKQWKNKFTPIHNIDLDYTYFFWLKESRISSLDSFMNKLLTQDGPRILSFRLCLRIHKRKHDPDYPSKWIHQILSKNIQNLAIEVYCSIIQFPVENCFPNLESLYLNAPNWCELTIQSERKHLLTFPALKVLEMRRCIFVKAKLVEINAPKLNTFKYSGIDEANSLVLYAPELHHAYFHLHEESQFNSREASALLMGTPRLKCLELSSATAVALVEYWKGAQAVIPAFDHLKRLKTCCQPRVIVELLQRMPRLESLNLPCLHDKHNEPLPPCTVSFLKEVEFYRDSGEIDLIKLFVENFRSLERVIVHVSILHSKSKDEIRTLLETLEPVNSS